MSAIHRAIILSVVLYGCKTRSLTLKEEHTLRVVENRVLKTLYGSNRENVTYILEQGIRGSAVKCVWFGAH